MEIVIKGTANEIEKAKSVIEETCFFNSEFCGAGIECDECEKKQKLKKEYIVNELK